MAPVTAITTFLPFVDCQKFGARVLVGVTATAVSAALIACPKLSLNESFPL
jgi:hypothetical protein